LQEKVIQRVGGREDIPLDTRIIAATNTDIAEAISQGDFREDLYYRIGVITISLPPLRERGDDIELLANYFLRRFGQEYGKKVRGFSIAARNGLLAYEWPGNVRELENKIKRAIIMAEQPMIAAADLGFKSDERDTDAEVDCEQQERAMPQELLQPMRGMTLKEARLQIEKTLLVQALEDSAGNIQRAAEQLAVTRPTLYDLLKKHNLFVPG
jgi:two-component system NtrC family response regulator